MRQSAKGWTEDDRLATVLAMAAANNRPLSITLRASSDTDLLSWVSGVPMAGCSPHVLSLRQPSGIFVAPMASVVALTEFRPS